MPVVVKKILKILLWTVVGILLLFSLLVFLIRLPSTQAYIVGKVKPIMAEKLGTTFDLKRLYISFPKNVTLEGLYLEDQKGDTLVSIGYMDVNIGLWGLLKSKVDVGNIYLENTTANLVRDSADGSFNFNFIIEAFQSNDPKPEPESEWEIDFGGLELESFRFTFLDHYENLAITAQLHQLNLNIDELNLDSLDFEADRFKLDGAVISVLLGESSRESDDEEETNDENTRLSVGVKKIDITNSQVRFSDASQNAAANINKLALKKSFFFLHEQAISTDMIELNNSTVHYEKTDSITTEGDDIDRETVSQKPWKIEAKAIKMQQNELQYDDHLKMPDTLGGMDYNHLLVKGLSCDIRNVAILGSDIRGDIRELSLWEKSGFDLRSLQAKVSMEGERIAVEKADLSTASSSFSLDAVFYPAFFLERNDEKNPSGIQLRDAEIHPSDVLYFAPQLAPVLTFDKPIYLSAGVEGWLHNLLISGFSLKVDSLNFYARGKVQGLPDIKKAYFDFPEFTLRSDNRSLTNVLPDSLLPENVQLPEEFKLDIVARGYLNDVQGNFSLVSSLGDVFFEGNYRNDTVSQVVKMAGELEIDGLELGQLLRNEELGKVIAHFSLDGEGTDMSTVDVNLEGRIDVFGFRDYEYQGIQIDGHFKENFFRGELAADNEDFKFDFEGLVDLNDSLPVLDLAFNLEYADLQTLNITTEDVKVGGRLLSEIAIDKEGRVNGQAALREIRAVAKGELYEVDSIVFNSLSLKDKTDIQVRSDVFSAGLTGNIDLLVLPKIVRQHLDRYFTQDGIEQDSLASEPSQFEFFVDLTHPEFFTEVLLPGLEEIDISTIEGSFDNLSNALTMHVDIPRLHYNAIELDSAELDLTTDNTRLTGSFSFALMRNNFFNIDHFDLTATSAKEALDLLVTIPFKGDDNFQMGARLFRKDSAYFLEFKQNEVVFSGVPWEVTEDNYLRLDDHFWIHNLVFSRSDKLLSAKSMVDEGDTTLQIDFRHFDLKTLGEPLGEQGSVLSGVANGRLTLLQQFTGLSFDTKLDITSLTFMEVLLGNMSLSNTYRNSRNNFDMAIRDGGADLRIRGFFQSSEETPEFEADVDIKKLDLKAIEPFVKASIAKLEGGLTGDLQLKSTQGIPDVEGTVGMKNVKITPRFTGAQLTVEDEQITLRNKSFSLSDFTITDDKGGAAVLNGKVEADRFPDYRLQMNLKANNFQMLSIKQGDNDFYYGDLRISGNGDITGDQDLLKVDAGLQVVDGSSVVYIVPRSQATVRSSEGLVNYVTPEEKKDPLLEAFAAGATDTISTSITGVDISANLAINNKSTLSIIIDQQTGDRLDVKGDAALTFRMPPSGEVILSGRYEVSSGSYKLNFYELAKREFQMVKGSYLFWTGDPLKARLNITTRYEVETLPPVPGINRRLPFYVNLNITGEVLEPELNFDLSMPDETQKEYANVYSFLQNINKQETELNKQVFSLIVFNSFMIGGSNTQSGDLVTGTARQSLSKILSQQLNRLAGNVDFVDMDLNLKSYETGVAQEAQGQTDLELGLSKSLFNNRVTIRVAGNVNLEGEQRSQQGMSDYAGDIVIEYKLSKDGVYRLQVFNKDEFNTLDQGQISKTGVGFIMVRDYDKVKELFEKREKVE